MLKKKQVDWDKVTEDRMTSHNTGEWIQQSSLTAMRSTCSIRAKNADHLNDFVVPTKVSSIAFLLLLEHDEEPTPICI